MGDVVSWTSLAGTVAAIGLAGGACFTVGLLWGKVNNGLSEGIKEVKEGMQSIWDKLDDLPCRTPHCPTEGSDPKRVTRGK